MENQLITDIEQEMLTHLDNHQMEQLHKVLSHYLRDVNASNTSCSEDNVCGDHLTSFIAAKRVEGCSSKSLRYYESTIQNMLIAVGKPVKHGELNERYLSGSIEKITSTAIKESAAKIFKAGSMLVGMYDTAALKLGILVEDSSSNQACANVLPNGDVNIVWLYEAIQAMKGHLLMKRQGCRQRNLSLMLIKSFEVALPPIDLQNPLCGLCPAGRQIKICSSCKRNSICRVQFLAPGVFLL